MKEHSFKQNSC